MDEKRLIGLAVYCLFLVTPIVVCAVFSRSSKSMNSSLSRAIPLFVLMLMGAGMLGFGMSGSVGAIGLTMAVLPFLAWGFLLFTSFRD